MTNIAVSQAVAPTHFYPPDPSSQIVCTIGGNVAENSGGAHCFKYGFTTNYVTGLEVVLPDGSVVQLGGTELDHPGYDLVGAFVGSEGTLGIATKIWLRVIPKPEAVRTLVAFFGSTVQAGEVVSRIVAEGIVPGAIEMMDNLSIRAAEGATNAGYPQDAGAALVVELDGSEAECEARFEHVKELCAEADSVRVAQDEAERDLIWRARKAAFAAMGRIAPNYYVQDSVIPRTRAGRGARPDRASWRRITTSRWRTSSTPATATCTRSSVTTASKPGEAERAEELAGLIVQACVDAGGSITGEHGVGVDKKRYMPAMFDEPDLATFQRLRCAFDPDGRANPGQGHAHAAAVRRGARPLPPAPARAGRAGGAVLMAVADARARNAGGPRRGARGGGRGGHAGPVPGRRAPSRPGRPPRRRARSSCPPPGSRRSSSTTPAT